MTSVQSSKFTSSPNFHQTHDESPLHAPNQDWKFWKQAGNFEYLRQWVVEEDEAAGVDEVAEVEAAAGGGRAYKDDRVSFDKLPKTNEKLERYYNTLNIDARGRAARAILVSAEEGTAQLVEIHRLERTCFECAQQPHGAILPDFEGDSA